MPSLENLKDILREVEALKHSEDYSLRIAATYANSALFKLEDPNANRAVIQNALAKVRGITKLYTSMDAGLSRVHQALGEWHLRFRPGPRPMEEDTEEGLVFLENSHGNPINLPGGDSVPGSVIHMFAKQHRYSREFAEEMEEVLATKEYSAKTPEDVHLYLTHVAGQVRGNGLVLHANPEVVDRAKKVLRMKEIPYDRYPVALGAMIWVPKDSKEEAIQALREAGYIQRDV